MGTSHPRLRSDLIVTSETEGDQVYYTIKDPLTNRFFRLRAPEYHLLSRADGATSPEEAAHQTGERFGIRIPPEAAAAFYAKMERLLFFEGPALERERPRLSRMALVGQQRSIGTIRLKAFDPEPWLAKSLPFVRFLFQPLSVGASVLLMLVAGIVVLGERQVWAASLADLWRFSSIPLLFAGIMTVGFVHEFGHALTLKHFGGSVREMGFLLLYFQPCFYCNLSDAYLLKDRRAKILVGLAGLFFQGLLTAVFVLLWRVVTPGTIVSDFLYVAVAFSLAVTLFNFNPLIRLDGYYLLADWLRIPNLRARAFAHWRGLLREWLTGREWSRRPRDRRTRMIYDWYGVLAAAYTGVLLGWVLFYLTRFVADRWGPLGAAGIYAVVLYFALRSTRADASTNAAASESESSETAASRRWMKPLILWGGLAVIVVAMALIKMERRVGSECRVEPSARFTVSSSVTGTVETELVEGGENPRRERSILLAVSADFSAVDYKIRVVEGHEVREGDTLLTLSSNLFTSNLHQKESQRQQTEAERNLLLSGPKKDAVLTLRAEIRQIEAERENKRAEVERGRQLMDRGLLARDRFDALETELRVLDGKHDAKSSELSLLIAGPKAEELAIKEAQIAALDANIAFLKSQIEASVLRSPIAGVVSRVNRGEVLVEVADLDPVRVELRVAEADVEDLHADLPVTLKARALPFSSFEGRVLQIAVAADTLDGGSTRFTVRTEIENGAGALRPGMTGHAKVACGERSLLALATRRLVHFIRVEFWSWW
ncbi:MAG: efflux RND transporter periplasmic adaptor subunit [Candidatus Zixiibacteriota bacterium]